MQFERLYIIHYRKRSESEQIADTRYYQEISRQLERYVKLRESYLLFYRCLLLSLADKEKRRQHRQKQYRCSGKNIYIVSEWPILK